MDDPKPLPADPKHYRIYRDGRVESNIKRGPTTDERSGSTWTQRKLTKRRNLGPTISIRLLDRSTGEYKTKQLTLSRQILMAFGPPPPSFKHDKVRYIDGNCANIDVSNLEWADRHPMHVAAMIKKTSRKLSVREVMWAELKQGVPLEVVAGKHGLTVSKAAYVMRSYGAEIRRQLVKAAERRRGE